MPPVTGTIQLFIFLILIYLAYRFYRVSLSEKNFISKFFSLVFILFGLIFFILGLPAIFLIENQSIWKIVVISTCLLQFLSAGVIGYIIFYLSFPRISPKWGYLLSLVEIPLVLPSIIYPSFYSFGSYGVANLEIDPLAGALRYVGILIFIIPAGIVFLRQAVSAKDKRIRIRAFGLGASFLGFTAVYLSDFILVNIFKLNSIIGDLLLAGSFLILLLILILTPRIMHRSDAKTINKSP